MFKKIYNFFKSKTLKEKARWAKINFLKNQDQRLPKYSPITGIKLKWDITIDKDGPYDIYTGDPLGEIYIWVTQKPPTYGEVLKDSRHYLYNVLTDELGIDELFEWKYVLNKKWDELCCEEGTVQLRHKGNK